MRLPASVGGGELQSGCIPTSVCYVQLSGFLRLCNGLTHLSRGSRYLYPSLHLKVCILHVRPGPRACHTGTCTHFLPCSYLRLSVFVHMRLRIHQASAWLISSVPLRLLSFCLPAMPLCPSLSPQGDLIVIDKGIERLACGSKFMAGRLRNITGKASDVVEARRLASGGNTPQLHNAAQSILKSAHKRLLTCFPFFLSCLTKIFSIIRACRY